MRTRLIGCAGTRLISPLLASLVQAVVAAAQNRTLRKDRSDGRLRLLLDDAAGAASLDGLPGLMAEGAEHGITTVACFTDTGQVAQRYGSAAVDGLLANRGGVLVLPGTTDALTRERLEKLSAGSSRRIAQLVRGKSALYVTGHLPSTALSMRHYFDSAVLRGRHMIPYGHRTDGLSGC